MKGKQLRFQYVPNSNRVQLLPPSKIAYTWGASWKELAEEDSARILRPTSPETIRMHKILTQIVQAMHDMLGLQNNCKVSVFVPEKKNDLHIADRNASVVIGHGAKRDLARSNKRVGKLGLKCGTNHLDGLNWKVMVVDSDEDNAKYAGNGKIKIYTGVFKGLKNSQSQDLEIATVLGHEAHTFFSLNFFKIFILYISVS
ncbi:hypothetical protein ACH5RR_000291 [Cinchona calisaya]|uniref:Peptidase M48 domain-containing protein n=1 Tax=Cinchona calisaya TaxID=153742 RepID=A0ABD3B096_9GENT